MRPPINPDVALGEAITNAVEDARAEGAAEERWIVSLPASRR